MQVKGILVQGKDGREYLVGIGPRTAGKQKERPTIWRLDPSGWTSLEETREASSTIRQQLGLTAPLQPGLTHDEHVKWAVLEGMSDLMTTFFGNARW